MNIDSELQELIFQTMPDVDHMNPGFGVPVTYEKITFTEGDKQFLQAWTIDWKSDFRN
jgi:hypothetical protein